MKNEDPYQELTNKILACRRCPRLVSWRESVANTKRKAYQDEPYWGKPVPGFGDLKARVLIIGLAPGAHGSNRTGRMFTGDASGKFLYQALYDAGFSSSPYSSSRNDGLVLKNIFITALCRCVPPGNKPSCEEIHNCSEFLINELNALENVEGIVALGKIAFEESLKLLKNRFHYVPPEPVKFRHNEQLIVNHKIRWLISSYHPSRQNTQTGRLTPDMFRDIWDNVNALLAS